MFFDLQRRSAVCRQTRARVFEAISVLVLAACHLPIGTQRDATKDYAVARQGFHTR
jgi:hypothetical protein